jgi:hypothetical protein
VRVVASKQEPLDAAALHAVLQDRAPSGVPICRDDPHDPDDENTLATAVFAIAGDRVDLSVYQDRKLNFQRHVVRAA